MRGWLETPIWQYEVQWEGFCRKTLPQKQYERYTNVLYSFLKAFPKKQTPSEFYVTDVEDWAVMRGREVRPRTLETEIAIIRYFFEWLRVEIGLGLANPATRRKTPRQPREEFHISLEQLEYLFAACQVEKDRLIVRQSLEGKKLREIAAQIGLAPETIRGRFARLRKRSNFPLQMKHLPRAYERLCFRLGEMKALAYLEDCLPSKTPFSSEAEPASCEPLPQSQLHPAQDLEGCRETIPA